MNVIRKIVLLLLCVLASSLLVVTPAQAKASCHKVNAQGVGQDLGNGITIATITGDKLLRGTTAGNFTVTGVSGTIATLAGTVKVTTHKGTLTVTVTGTFNVATGEFSATGVITDATGKLDDATGNLLFKGVENLSTGSFVEDVTGKVCLED